MDAAVLDLVIGHDRCEEFASRLAAARVPIVFASGMRDPASLPEALREVPTVDKPYTSQALHGALAGARAPGLAPRLRGILTPELDRRNPARRRR